MAPPPLMAKNSLLCYLQWITHQTLKAVKKLANIQEIIIKETVTPSLWQQIKKEG